MARDRACFAIEAACSGLAEILVSLHVPCRDLSCHVKPGSMHMTPVCHSWNLQSLPACSGWPVIPG